MAPAAAVMPHHHRSTAKPQKAFKSRHASKGAIKDRTKGKTEAPERGSRKTPHQQLMTKLDRRNQARQKQRLKHQNKTESLNIFSGSNGAPRVTAVIPLAPTVDTHAAVRSLNDSLDIPETETVSDEQGKIFCVRVERFKQNVAYVPVPMNLVAVLDACRMADFVVLVFPAQEELNEAELFLKAIEGQGISNVLATVQGLDMITSLKKRPQFVGSLKSYLSRFFPTVEKILSLDSRQECSNVVRSICTGTPKGIHWRDDRSWMLVENVRWPDKVSERTEVVITGVVRGKGLKADRLVHIPGWGDFQVSQIVDATPLKQNKKGDSMTIDETGPRVVDQPTEDRDDLAVVAPEEVVMDDAMSEAPEKEKKGVLLDEHHYFSDDDEEKFTRPRRLPKGTSDYQAAWYLDDVSDSGSDIVDEMNDEDQEMGMDDAAGPEDGVFDVEGKAATEAAPSEYPQSEMFVDPSPEEEARQLEEYRASRRKEAEEDLEFPDEIELHPTTIARERLARYRGLRSLKTSSWSTIEDRPYEPEDWRRLLQIADYKGSRNRCIREALAGGVRPGLRVDVYIKDVPTALKSRSPPISLFSLLRHEHKHSVVNINITLSSAIDKPIKSKEELIFQYGPRRLVVNPIFSASGNTPNNVHKFDRFLHPGRSAIASFIGPVLWGSVPVLVFRRAGTDPDAMGDDAAVAASNPSDNLELVGTGTMLPPDPSRVVTKRVILTGHPYKINKKVVTVRYMFFNAEDVNWFKALQLWTKRGRSGFIKESLGTHGYFKATFDARINPQDAIGVSLYKRVFPRKARDLEM